MDTGFKHRFVLGINWEQNSSIALFESGRCLAAVSNERFSRKKNDETYPKEAIEWALEKFNVDVQALCVVFVSKTWSPAWILMRHYTSFDIADYLREQNEFWYPRFYQEKNPSIFDIFSDKLDLDQFPGASFWGEVVKRYDQRSGHVSDFDSEGLGQQIRCEVIRKHLGKVDVFFMDHSSCHTSYAYFSQPDRSQPRLTVSIDAYGDGVNYSARIYRPSKGKIEIEKVVESGDCIIARLYRYITLILGLKPNEHEYKVMGLAPYTKEKYYLPILEKFLALQDVDGIFFKYKKKPRDLFFSIRQMLFSERFDAVAGALQAYTERLTSTWVRNLVETTGVRDICMAGGVAMNVKANLAISAMEEVNSLWVPPAPDDTSQAIGAAYHFLHSHQGVSPLPLEGPYLGREPGLRSLQEVAEQYGNAGLHTVISDDYISCAAKILASGGVLGIVWGREEFGARALGNRSIVADPRGVAVKEKINEKIKDRDFWMPFAASILEDYAATYLMLDDKPQTYGYMTKSCCTTELGSVALSAGIHPYDKTCRPHIVVKGSNPDYESLINAFGRLTGTYALLNTSLNVHGSPICSTFEDAMGVFDVGQLDGLLFSDGLLVRKNIEL